MPIQHLIRLAVLRCSLLLLLVWGLFGGSAAAATTATGIWSAGSQYLAIAESVSPPAVVIVQLDLANPAASSLYVGARSGQVISAPQVGGGGGSISLTMDSANTSYSGTQTAGTSTTTISGSLLFAYAGGPHDGAWQRSGTGDRFLLTMTLSVNQVATTVLADLLIGQTVTYDLAAGVVVTAGAAQGGNPTFTGKSVLSGNNVTMVFRGGAPATGTYSVVGTTRPPQTLVQFDAVQVLSFSP